MGFLARHVDGDSVGIELAPAPAGSEQPGVMTHHLTSNKQLTVIRRAIPAGAVGYRLNEEGIAKLATPQLDAAQPVLLATGRPGKAILRERRCSDAKNSVAGFRLECDSPFLGTGMSGFLKLERNMSQHNFLFFFQRLAKIVGDHGQRPGRGRRSRRNAARLENLELRNMLSALAWSTGANLPGAAAGLVAQPDGANLLLMAEPSTTSYDLSAAYPSWKATSSATVQPLDFARSSPGVGPLPGGLFLIFGGLENGFASSAVTQYDPHTVTVVDGATNQTRSLRSMNVPRAEFGWATDANHLSYAIGGQDNNGTPLATTEVYNPTANTWTYLASLPQTLYGESALSDGAGHIYTFGGVGANGQINNIVYRYTIATNTWDTSASAMQVGVRDSAAVLAPNGLIYVIAGNTSAGAS